VQQKLCSARFSKFTTQNLCRAHELFEKIKLVQIHSIEGKFPGPKEEGTHMQCRGIRRKLRQAELPRWGISTWSTWAINLKVNKLGCRINELPKGTEKDRLHYCTLIVLHWKWILCLSWEIRESGYLKLGLHIGPFLNHLKMTFWISKKRK
jgi:hypothetical protein